jgi:uncharacterized membrane protein
MTDMPEKSVGIKLWMRVIFFFSLGINLLVVGALVGLMFIKPSVHERRLHSTRNLVQPFIRALEPDDREVFRKSMVLAVRQPGSDRRPGLVDRQAALELLTADPFVRSDFADYLTEQFKNIRKIQGVGRELLLDRIVEMSSEDRLAYADRLARQMKRRKKFDHVTPAKPERLDD